MILSAIAGLASFVAVVVLAWAVETRVAARVRAALVWLVDIPNGRCPKCGETFEYCRCRTTGGAR